MAWSLERESPAKIIVHGCPLFSEISLFPLCCITFNTSVKLERLRLGPVNFQGDIRVLIFNADCLHYPKQQCWKGSLLHACFPLSLLTNFHWKFSIGRGATSAVTLGRPPDVLALEFGFDSRPLVWSTSDKTGRINGADELTMSRFLMWLLASPETITWPIAVANNSNETTHVVPLGMSRDHIYHPCAGLWLRETKW